ncbi:hypothetical protein GQX73_g1342 [Xylaria multiplex]|uniref:Uncharacterized protein n=1 Tax=Xylaria multiplex TaxID=323545 RepID=A0A7C8MZV6_9PEZI|nr:hypothetical protein GQX73_g1342 [Xylaria multiplex]
MSSGSGSDLVPAFVQQGSVDWVDLAKAQVKLTVGVLSRLSRARIEAITYHAAHVIFFPAQFSNQGQMRVYDATQKVVSFPTLSKALWVGFGVKHIIHEFAATHEGLVCIGICAALTEHFAISHAANIVLELWKMRKLPPDYTPALHQWIALVEACSGILAPTDFPLTLGRIMRYFLSDGVSNIRAASSQKSIAEVLYAVFEAPKKNIREVHISGGVDCAWVAAVAHWLLGFLVDIVDNSGAILWTSPQDLQSPGEHTKLVVLINAAAEQELQIIKRCHVLDGGQSLVPGQWDEETRRKMVSLGRVPWATCLVDTFGTPARKLLIHGQIAGWCLGSAARVFDAYMCNEYAPNGQLRNVPPANSASTCRGFITATRNLLPELCANTQLIESMEIAAGKHLNEAQRNYTEYMSSLSSLCACPRCTETSQDTGYRFCMVQLVPLICSVVRIFYHTRMSPDLPIAPSIAGLEQLYWEHAEFNLKEATDMWAGQDLLSLVGILFSCTETYKVVSNIKSTRSSAVSANGLCFYMNTLCNPTGSPGEATLVHIVPGRVQFNDFTYEHIVDDDDEINKSEYDGTQETEFFCRSVSIVDEYDTVAASSSEGLESQLNIVETADNSRVIKASYHIFQKVGKGTVKLGPRQLFNDLCYAYTASDCRGKQCQPPTGVRSVWANEDGYLTTDLICPLGPAPIIRVLPHQSLALLVALTQHYLKDDPAKSRPPRDSGGRTRYILRKQLQGNQCVLRWPILAIPPHDLSPRCHQTPSRQKMAPPSNAERAARERMIRRTVDRMDPEFRTPPVLRELIIEYGARLPTFGGALIQAAIDFPPAPGLVQGRGRGRGQGQGQAPGTAAGSNLHLPQADNGAGTGGDGAGRGAGAGAGAGTGRGQGQQ